MRVDQLQIGGCYEFREVRCKIQKIDHSVSPKQVHILLGRRFDQPMILHAERPGADRIDDIQYTWDEYRARRDHRRQINAQLRSLGGILDSTDRQGQLYGYISACQETEFFELSMRGEFSCLAEFLQCFQPEQATGSALAELLGGLAG